MSKAELLILCPTSAPSARLHHLSEWQLHLKPKLMPKPRHQFRLLLFPLHSISSKLGSPGWTSHKLYPKPQVEATILQLTIPTASPIFWALTPSSFTVD